MKLFSWFFGRRRAAPVPAPEMPPAALTDRRLEAINRRREAHGGLPLTMAQAQTVIANNPQASAHDHNWLVWYMLLTNAAAPSTPAENSAGLGQGVAPVQNITDLAQVSHSHEIGSYTHNLTSASDSASGFYDLGSSSSSYDSGSSFSSGGMD